ncbi:MAG: sulfotransferase [Bacteroidales bacterium]|nr:sulfotransferase [Bacteroidales bacterium]
MKNKVPIIVTGAHRSGTTWVGQMIALNKQVRYIHEPFNIDEKRIHPLKYWFEYITFEDTPEKQNEVYTFIDEILDFNLSGINKDFKTISGPRDILRFIEDSYKRINKRPLLKDPIAIMSIDWLVKKFNAQAVILIRHPAAFVASLKVKDWKHSFDHYIKQPNLMTLLEPFADQIKLYDQSKPDIIDQGILLWNISYFRVLQYKTKYPNWIYTRHEDLSLNPVEEFRNIYEKLNLKFTNKIKNKIIESTSAKKDDHLKRDSKKNISSWKKRLDKEEIDRIIQGTENISNHFYNKEDW